MLGSLWLLEPYLDPGCSDLMVSYFDPELRLCRSWVWFECGILAPEFIPRLERYR
jgi:hypothetical protein